MEYRDYYRILGIDRDTTQDEIKRSYRKLARQFHPDINKAPEAEEKFKEIGEAYEVLNDPEKRAAYDKFGSNWQQGQDFHPPPDWDAGFEFSGAEGGRANQTEFSDFFSELFGSSQFRQGQGRSFSMAGEDQHARILVTLVEAWHGAKRTFTLTKPAIDDEGRLVNKQHTITVTIPKGIAEGQKIRLSGQGMPGQGGGSHGDLYLEISFEKHPLFRVEKRDIHLTLPVTPWEAALGGKIECPTLGGAVHLDIPANSQSGGKLRLKGRGLSSASHAGDQIVTLEIVTPPATTKKEKELYRDMAKTMPMNPRQSLMAS
jgi:curved DNA-binding protein